MTAPLASEVGGDVSQNHSLDPKNEGSVSRLECLPEEDDVGLKAFGKIRRLMEGGEDLLSRLSMIR
jgi:hypothetical protein